MGMHQYTKIGPYLKIPNRQEDVTRKIRVDEHGKEVKSGHKFDPVTGEAYKELYVTETVDQRPDTYPETMEDEAWFEANGFSEDEFYQGEGCETKTHQIFICNAGGISLGGYDGGELEISLMGEVLKFKTKYKKLLEFYTKKYGPVEVGYGAITYWS